MTRYIYFHGFASSPASAKAQDLRQRLGQLGLKLTIPDLNQGDFSRLTLSRQIRQGQDVILAEPGPVVLLGSSFGGLTAAWLGAQPAVVERIQALVLLAPAFQFLDQWLPRFRPAQLTNWQTTGTMAVFHYGEKTLLPLHYGFIEDAQQYDETRLQQPIPTLILHGRQDQVISIAASRTYASQRPWVQLVELESDHALLDVQAEIWRHIQQFLGQLPGQRALGRGVPHPNS